MSSSPLVTITFAGPQGVATRHVSHVPRVGDLVVYRADGDEDDNLVAGRVANVLWDDDGVHVDVTMGDDLDEQMRAVKAGR